LKKGKAFVLVSSRRWGKAHTLAVLTSGKPLRRFLINGIRFAIRRMSNDEDDEGFFNLLEYMFPDSRPHVILAMCPTFKEDRRRLPLIAALTDFSKRYDLFFFVLGRQGKPPGKRIKADEIAPLAEFGVMEIFGGREPVGRAAAFKKFILAHM
jgi:hypothetical protein